MYFVSKKPQILLGGTLPATSIADVQQGPTCGFEALENLIQLLRGGDNHLSDTLLKPWARHLGHLEFCQGEESLHPGGYQQLLQLWTINTSWHSFDHSVLVSALLQRRVVVAVLDPYYIDVQTYPTPGYLHAIILTGCVYDAANGIVSSYWGLDSNWQSRIRQWSAVAMERAAAAWEYTPLLITHESQPVRKVRPIPVVRQKW